MPSKSILAQKQTVVAELCDRMKRAKTGILVDYKGITVLQDTKLRAELRKSNVNYTVVKNTLMEKAIAQIGFEKLSGVLMNTTALATSDEDLVAPAKILCEYAKKNPKFSIKAGFIEGAVVDAASVESLAELPSKEVLVAKMLGSFNAPITGFVNVLNGNIRGLVVALSAIAEQKAPATA